MCPHIGSRHRHHRCSWGPGLPGTSMNVEADGAGFLLPSWALQWVFLKATVPDTASASEPESLDPQKGTRKAGSAALPESPEPSMPSATTGHGYMCSVPVSWRCLSPNCSHAGILGLHLHTGFTLCWGWGPGPCAGQGSSQPAEPHPQP